LLQRVGGLPINPRSCQLVGLEDVLGGLVTIAIREGDGGIAEANL